MVLYRYLLCLTVIHVVDGDGGLIRVMSWDGHRPNVVVCVEGDNGVISRGEV